MTKRITLTRKGFREWLVGKPGEEWVGHSYSYSDCPIATYLCGAGMKTAVVGVVLYGAPGGEDARIPEWACSFISQIDKGISRYITARQALAVLDGKEPTP